MSKQRKEDVDSLREHLLDLMEIAGSISQSIPQCAQLWECPTCKAPPLEPCESSTKVAPALHASRYALAYWSRREYERLVTDPTFLSFKSRAAWKRSFRRFKALTLHRQMFALGIVFNALDDLHQPARGQA